MACNCGNKLKTQLVCTNCGTEAVVRHYKSRDPLSAAADQRLACPSCGGTTWQTK